MSIITFAKAERQGAPTLISLYGLSGSGKTYSALLIAGGLVGPKGRICMIDTEMGRGRIYADEPGMPSYDYGLLTPPYTPERYIAAIDAAEAAGYDVIVLDSASHEWEGEGGVVEEADEGKSKSGAPLEGLVKWAKPKAKHKKFIGRLLKCKAHLVICLRAKEKMTQKGREVVSEGWVSIQDKRFIYETTVQLFFPTATDDKLRGVPVVEKCPRALLGAFAAGQRVTMDTGKRIGEWIHGGTPVDHALVELRAQAVEIAERGTEAFRAWWRDNPNVRPKLSGELENLKSIAMAADEERIALAAQSAAKPIQFAPVNGAVPSADPFDREPGDDTGEAGAESLT